MSGAIPDSVNHDLSSPLLSPAERSVPAGEYKKMGIDEMLQRHCGEFGIWQLRHFVLTTLAWALEAFHTMVMIFADHEPDWCCTAAAGPGCSTKGRSMCGLDPRSWEWVGGPGGSTVSEWGLVCGERYKVGLVQSLFFGGCMVELTLFFNITIIKTVVVIQRPHSRSTDDPIIDSTGRAVLFKKPLMIQLSTLLIELFCLALTTESISSGRQSWIVGWSTCCAGVFGHLSDSFLGRKGSLTVVCILNAVFGCLTALSPTYWIYALLRFLTGFSTGGVGLCAFVLATEPIGPTKRGAAGMSTFYLFSSGIAILSGIAYVFRTWRTLYIASSIPSIIFVLVVIPFISESPRWYLVRGKIDQAMKLMRTIARRNGKNLPNEVLLTLDDDENKEQEQGAAKDVEVEAVAGSLMDVIKMPLTRTRLLLTIVINFCCSVVYYGLSLNVVNLGTNLHLNVLLNAVSELPAFFLTAILLDRLGRKPLTIGTMWFSGVFCFAGSLMRSDGAWKVVRMVCGILGIFGMSGTYNLLFIYTVELFPTVVRSAALGCITQAAQMGALLAPLVVVLGGGIPFAVFGTCGVIGGLLAFYLPETLSRPLYDTMAGMEEGENAYKGM